MPRLIAVWPAVVPVRFQIDEKIPIKTPSLPCFLQHFLVSDLFTRKLSGMVRLPNIPDQFVMFLAGPFSDLSSSLRHLISLTRALLAW
jgi:hypothetical protein